MEEQTTSPVPDAPAVVIAIAATPDQRLRLSELVNGHAPVLLVSTAEEAMAFLVRLSPGGLPVSAAPPVVPEVTEADPTPTSLDVDSDWRIASWQNHSVGLSPLEHDLLQCLLGEVGHIITFEDLQHRVWGNDHLGGRSHLQSVVKRLRRKLKDIDSPLQIDSVRGVGLRLVDVRSAPHAGPDVPLPRADREPPNVW